MLVDFCREQSAISPLEVNGQIIEKVEKYKYLGAIIDHKLTFKPNSESIFASLEEAS